MLVNVTEELEDIEMQTNKNAKDEQDKVKAGGEVLKQAKEIT